MCGFIQFPDLKNAFNYWQNWSERQEQQKRQQKPILLWPLTARPSPVQERYHNWPFGALNIYKHFPAHSPFFPFNTSIHSFTAVFPRRFILRNRLKKKKAQWGSNSLLYTQKLCGGSTDQRRAEMCISVHRTKVFPSRCPKQGTREGKQVLFSELGTNAPRINKEWQVFWQTRHPHTSLIIQELAVRSGDVCVWLLKLHLCLEPAPGEHLQGSSHLSHECLVMLTQRGRSLQSPTRDPSHRIARVQENGRKSMHPGRRRWVSPSLTQCFKGLFPRMKTAPLLLSPWDSLLKRSSSLVLQS